MGYTFRYWWILTVEGRVKDLSTKVSSGISKYTHCTSDPNINPGYFRIWPSAKDSPSRCHALCVQSSCLSLINILISITNMWSCTVSRCWVRCQRLDVWLRRIKRWRVGSNQKFIIDINQVSCWPTLAREINQPTSLYKGNDIDWRWNVKVNPCNV